MNNISTGDKEYLVLLKYNEFYTIEQVTNEGALEHWKFLSGRKEVWLWLIDLLTDEAIDPMESYVIVDSVRISDKISVAEFMKHVKQYFPSEAFDIRDYITEDEYDSLSTEAERYAKEKVGLIAFGESIVPGLETDVGYSEQEDI